MIGILLFSNDLPLTTSTYLKYSTLYHSIYYTYWPTLALDQSMAYCHFESIKYQVNDGGPWYVGVYVQVDRKKMTDSFFFFFFSISVYCCYLIALFQIQKGGTTVSSYFKFQFYLTRIESRHKYMSKLDTLSVVTFTVKTLL